MSVAKTELSGHRLEARHHIEQLAGNLLLAHAAEATGDLLEPFIDVLLSGLHRRQATAVLGGKRLGQGAKQHEEVVLAQQMPQQSRAWHHRLRELP